MIIHLAAVVSPVASMRHPDSTNSVNVAGTMDSLRAGLAAETKRVVYGPSSSVHGNVPSIESPKLPRWIHYPLWLFQAGGGKVLSSFLLGVWTQHRLFAVLRCLWGETIVKPVQRRDSDFRRWLLRGCDHKSRRWKANTRFHSRVRCRQSHPTCLEEIVSEEKL